MKITALLLSILLTNSLIAQVSIPPNGNSQRSQVTQYIGSLVRIQVNYGSPRVTNQWGQSRMGEIWGGLVPYGLRKVSLIQRNEIPWRAGANENTTIAFSHEVLITGNPLPAGTYGFHLIPREDSLWTVIFSNTSTDWGSFRYQPENDALRIQVRVEPSHYQEWLQYLFTEKKEDGTTLTLQWEELQLSLPIQVPDMDSLYVQTFRKELKGKAGFSWIGYQQAAEYCAIHQVNLPEALKWAKFSSTYPVIGSKNYKTWSTWAHVLFRMGREEEARKKIREAIRECTEGQYDAHFTAGWMITPESKDWAEEIFRANYEVYDGLWPTSMGLAKVLNANGKVDEAIAVLEKVNRKKLKESSQKQLDLTLEKYKTKKEM